MKIRTKTPIRTLFKVPFKIIQKDNDFLTDILFPHRYPVYGDIILPKGNLICPGCIAKLSWVRRPVYKRCGREVLDETIEYCRDCAGHKRSFDYKLSPINYDDAASRSMARIKYNNRRKYLDLCSEAMVGRIGKRIRSMDGDTLILVPIHPSRLRGGGLDQTEESARRLFGPLGISVNTFVLKGERKTAPQKNLDPSGRLRNLEQAFTAAALPSAMQKVILVDDIYTAGSAIGAYARILEKADTEHVYFVTIFIGHER